jgi:GntR family transcriptional regulator, transcriptional repressor for pyruvate dehydrogenase complex
MRGRKRDIDAGLLPRRADLYPSFGKSESASSPALVEQVVGCVCSALESRRLHPGDQLPAERELALHLEVSRSTIRWAVGSLSAMGLLRIRRGVGTFVSSEAPKISAATLQAMEALHGFEPWQMSEARQILEGSLSALAAESGPTKLMLCGWPRSSQKCMRPAATRRSI